MGKAKKNLILENQVLAREEQIKRRSKLFSHVSASCLAIVFVLLISQFELDGLKGILVDGLFHTQWWGSPDPEIALIAYDDDSSARYEGSQKIPAEELAQVLNFLTADGPKAVALIGNINDKTYNEAELSLIGKGFSTIQNGYLGYTDDESLGKSLPAGLSAANGKLNFVPGFIARDNFSYGADGVTRRVMITIDGLPTLYSKIASLFRVGESSATFKNSHAYGRVGDSLQTYINYQGRAGTYQTMTTRAVAEHRITPGTFRNKIVLIGSTLSARRTDYILSPYSRDPGHMTLLEAAANSLVTLIRDNGIFKTPSTFNVLISFLLGILTVNLVLFLPPGRGILFVLIEIAALTLISWLGLFGLRLWIDLAHPLIVACVGYYLVIPYRLVDEYRQRWHYQEKSELMAQLEQLKSNFLSLVSHDLKTPIARIQGNAELTLNDQKGALTPKQRECLAAIVSTTDDLSQYVETVLDLTRIESAQVPLTKLARDINATVLEVVESKRFMAIEKNITLETHLEPMFSFRFDPKLIRRVLANLLENAIKYSPENTTIVFSSREEGSWIRIAVKDQGFGITGADQERIFEKFYRGSSEPARNTKGTGLGLYLVKYFVELHQGMVELSSEAGKGSIFTVSLPV